MIRIGIIGNIQDEEQIFQTLHHCKNTELTGLYNPERDSKSVRFKVYHNPVELLEVSDALAVYHAERLSADFIRLLIRKSKHIYFHSFPVLTVSEAADILKLQKEAGTVIHLYNPYFLAHPGIVSEIASGVKIINLQLKLDRADKHLSAGIMHALVFLNKIGNSPVKHSEVLGLPGKQDSLTVNIHTICSNGSVYNMLLSGESIKSEVHIFQKQGFVFYEIPDTDHQQAIDNLAFKNFIESIAEKKTEGIVFEDYANSLKSFLDVKEKLNYSGIGITN